jgi:hypothetical protein
LLLLAMVALFLCALPGPAWAPCDPNCPDAPPGGVTIRDTPNFSFVRASPFRSVDKFVLGAGLGYAFPTEPMKAKQRYVKVVPGLWSSSGEQDAYLVASKFQGYLLGGSVLYGITDHWGVNFTGIWEQSNKGSAEPVTLFQGGPHSHLRLPGDARGYIVGLGAVFDPVAGARFRLPIVVGIGHNYYSATVEGSFAVSNPGGSETFRYYGNHSVSRFSAYLGVAPQADVGNLRFVPFVITSDSTVFSGQGRSTVRLENLSSGASDESKLYYRELTYLSAGLTVKYLPWNLGLSYIRGDVKSRGIDTDIYALIFDRRW